MATPEMSALDRAGEFQSAHSGVIDAAWVGDLGYLDREAPFAAPDLRHDAALAQVLGFLGRDRDFVRMRALEEEIAWLEHDGSNPERLTERRQQLAGLVAAQSASLTVDDGRPELSGLDEASRVSDGPGEPELDQGL